MQLENRLSNRADLMLLSVLSDKLCVEGAGGSGGGGGVVCALCVCVCAGKLPLLHVSSFHP